jgi:hypothetical protein
MHEWEDSQKQISKMSRITSWGMSRLGLAKVLSDSPNLLTVKLFNAVCLTSIIVDSK